MSRVILLTAKQADQVRGVSVMDPSAALDPVAISDGRFILPIEVLDDPAHAKHHEFLSGLPKIEMSAIEKLLIREEPE